jgi:CheY-like chemotaxis protein
MGCTSGSGLGLSVVYGIVKDHQAFYDILTAPGQGTDFRLFFPATAVGPTIEEPGNSRVGGNESILVIDDNQDQRDVAAELLRSLGYSVQTVPSGEAAIEYLRSNTADLLLLDMIMDPGMDGLDTYRQVLKLHPEQKAVVASGFSATERVHELLRLGAEIGRASCRERVFRAV